MHAAILSCFLLFGQTQNFDSVLREGLIALQKGDLETARDRLTNASSLRPESGIVWVALAQTWSKLGKTEEADQAAVRAQAAEANNAVVLRSLILYWSGRGQLQRLIEAADRAVRIQPSADLHNLLGKAYVQLGDVSKGIEHLKSAAGLEPSSETYIFELGQALMAAERFDEAATVFSDGAKRLPASAQLQLALGVARYGQRRFEDAVAAFLSTVALQPDTEQPYVFLGRILEHAGDRLPEIRMRFRAYLDANPDSAAASLLYARVLAATPESDVAEMEKLLRRSITLNAGSWEAHLDLGVLLFKKRAFAEAASELERAVQLNSKEPVPHYHLARTYDRLGKKSEAARERALHEALTGNTRSR